MCPVPFLKLQWSDHKEAESPHRCVRVSQVFYGWPIYILMYRGCCIKDTKEHWLLDDN